MGLKSKLGTFFSAVYTQKQLYVSAFKMCNAEQSNLQRSYMSIGNVFTYTPNICPLQYTPSGLVLYILSYTYDSDGMQGQVGTAGKQGQT